MFVCVCVCVCVQLGAPLGAMGLYTQSGKPLDCREKRSRAPDACHSVL